MQNIIILLQPSSAEAEKYWSNSAIRSMAIIFNANIIPEFTLLISVFTQLAFTNSKLNFKSLRCLLQTIV